MVRLLLVLAVLALAGCGGGEEAPEPVDLVLDFTPNAAHAGLFGAAQQGLDRAEGVRLRVRQPPASSTGLRLLLAGRADVAVLDIHDLALARQEGRDVVAVAPLVQAPLASVLAGPGVRDPADLEGRRVGVAGLPSDRAVLRSVVAGAGGDPRRVRAVTIGFNAVPSLLSRRVDAVTAFWNVEGLELRRRRPATRIFRLEAYGAPRYPELVLAVTGRTLRERRGLVRAVATVAARGTRWALDDPDGAAAALLAADPSLERPVVTAQLRAIAPALRPVGRFDRGVLPAWARWEARFGITERPPDVAAAFPAVGS